ncbi:hypothetical protein ACH4D5_34045 [Streptomyces sp. NPDC018029]|uniref:hypothetical protein n=1 Tax=Streptomyces sp. NPDC018029 TaxID=3365032 RepID=UPI0037B0088F
MTDARYDVTRLAWVHIGTGSRRHLLIHRNRTTGELAFYRCWSPTEVTLAELARVPNRTATPHPNRGRRGVL